MTCAGPPCSLMSRAGRAEPTTQSGALGHVILGRQGGLRSSRLPRNEKRPGLSRGPCAVKLRADRRLRLAECGGADRAKRMASTDKIYLRQRCPA